MDAFGVCRYHLSRGDRESKRKARRERDTLAEVVAGWQSRLVLRPDFLIAPDGLSRALIDGQRKPDPDDRFDISDYTKYALVAFTLDQLFPTMEELKQFLHQSKGKGIHIGLVDDNLKPIPTGDLLFALSAVEGYHSRSLKARAEKAHATAKLNGRFPGKPPWGMHRNGDLLSPAHGEAVAYIIKTGSKESHKGDDRPSPRTLAARVMEKFGLSISHMAVARIIRDHNASTPTNTTDTVEPAPTVVVPPVPFAGIKQSEPDPAVARREQIQRNIATRVAKALPKDEPK